MSRIRTIKPEFWTDDLIGSMSREQRLLFIASWNLADDEGLLRWSSAYLKGAVFPFDDDLSVDGVEQLMGALCKAGVVHAYLGGRSQQRLAYIINFHKHQKINRPSPSKLPPPSIQQSATRQMYAERDGFICHLCDGHIDEVGDEFGDDFAPSIDHLIPSSQGGSDYPTNLRCSHQTCNKGRCNRSIEEYRALVMSGNTASQKRFPERFSHLSLNNSVSNSHNGSHQEREREVESDEELKKDGGGGSRATPLILISAEAIEIADEVGVIAGLNPTDRLATPPGWCGAAARVQTWLAHWPRETILAGVRAGMARKRDGPPENPRYFEKPIARAHLQISAPIPLAPEVSYERAARAPRTSSNAEVFDDIRAGFAAKRGA